MVPQDMDVRENSQSVLTLLVSLWAMLSKDIVPCMPRELPSDRRLLVNNPLTKRTWWIQRLVPMWGILVTTRLE